MLFSTLFLYSFVLALHEQANKYAHYVQQAADAANLPLTPQIVQQFALQSQLDDGWRGSVGLQLGYELARVLCLDHYISAGLPDEPLQRM